MTDITELAQREKFEAWFKSSFHPDKTGPYIKDQLYFAWKAASAELVEALESEKRICATWRKTAEANSEKLEKAQAENTAGVAGMAESYETTISMLRSRIAELESRTVNVKLLTPEVRNALKAEGLADVLKDVAEYAPLTVGQWETLTKNWYQTFIGLSGSAAGIKVEAE
ncbi:TPA: hypothetical protein ACHV5P_000857 [Klebsiella variicola]